MSRFYQPSSPIGSQPPTQRPGIASPSQPTTAPLQDWGQYVQQRSPAAQPQARPSTGNALADHYQAQSDELLRRSQSAEGRHGGPDAGPALKNFYREQEAFWGGPAATNHSAQPAKTVYHANGGISNPPAEDPGFRVYNHLAEMPAVDRRQVQEFQSGYRTIEGNPLTSMAGTGPHPSQSPALSPDPSKQVPAIGVPSRGQAMAGTGTGPTGGGGGFMSVPPGQTAPLFDSHQSMRQAMIGGLGRDMQAAHAKGDNAGLYDLFAQRAALDNGGFVGHSRYMQEKALHAAQTVKANGANGGLIGADGTMDPTRMFDRGLDQTNSIEGGLKAQQTARILNAINDEQRGKQGTLRAEDSGMAIKEAYPQLQQFFGSNKGTPDLSMADALKGIQGQKPEVFTKPQSVAGQAVREGIKQLYGNNLSDELDTGYNPRDLEWGHFKKTGQPQFDAAVNLIPQAQGNVQAMLGNLFTGRFGSIWNPQGAHDESARTNDLYRQLTGNR
jgi:hypothetical protein